MRLPALALSLSLLLAFPLWGCGGRAAPALPGAADDAGAGADVATAPDDAAPAVPAATADAAPAPRGGFCPEVTPSDGWSCTPNNYHDPLVSYVALSGFMFRGTVTALNAATPGINVTDTSRTVIAHVDAVLDDGYGLDLAGQDVTVELLAAPTMAVGYAGYFFTDVFTLGASVGVTEVAHLDLDVDPTMAADVPGIEQLLADERLEARLRTAGAVVVGTVTAVTSIANPMPGSEHDPLWAAATITADCALHGATPATATVAFATSTDVMWYASPKLTVGQQGVFFLQPAPSPPASWPLPASVPYVVTDPLDVQPADARGRVATLVLCPPTR